MRPCDALVAALTPAAQGEAGSSVAVCRVLAAPFYRGLAAFFVFFFFFPNGRLVAPLLFILLKYKKCVCLYHEWGWSWMGVCF